MSSAKAYRVVAIVALLAFVVAFAFWHSRRSAARHQVSTTAGSTPRAGTASRSQGSAIDSTTATALDAERTAAPTTDLISRDPAAAAKRWNTRAWNVLYANDRRRYGDDVARLMQLPYDEAWDDLVARAKEGDLGAGAAAMQIASICSAESTRGARPDVKLPPASHYFKDLPETWKPFVDRIGELHDDDHRRLTHCEGVGDVHDLATLFFDRFFTADNPEAQIEIAGDNKDHKQAIADLREILAAHDIPRGRSFLGDLLMQSDDAGERAQGRAMLEALAPSEPEVATRLAYCLEHGCGGSTPDPAAARPWLEQSAGLGDWLGLSYLIDALDKRGDRAAAWAWSSYALDLAVDGCFEMLQPMYVQIAARATDEAKRKVVLTPAEQNAGLAISYAIEGRWGEQARQRLACD